MRVVIIEDDRQHEGKHDAKHDAWDAMGVPYIPRSEMVKLDFGDYMRGFEDGTLDESCNISVDTKQHLGEVSTNLGKHHERFKREIRRANDAGYLLVVLVETDEAGCIEDVRRWVNIHCRHCNHFLGKRCDPIDGGMCLKHGTKPPLQGEVMAKQMKTMEANRSVRFEFVTPDMSAVRICELLGVAYDTET